MANFAVETTLNEIADKIGMDPIDLRLKNANKEGDTLVSGLKLGRIGLTKILEAANRAPSAGNLQAYGIRACVIG